MCHTLFACSHVKIGPHVYIGPDCASRVQLSCFPRRDIRASEIQILEVLSKRDLNDLRKAFGVALIHCLTDISGSKERDQVKVLSNPGESDFSLNLHLMFCLVLRHEYFIPF